MRRRFVDAVARSMGLVAAGFASFGVAQQEVGLLNYVVASDRLHTSGQPDSEQLLTLADRGFDLVINLATPTSPNTVPEEGQLVTQGGIAYVNIPVDWQAPTYEDFEFFSGTLNHSR